MSHRDPRGKLAPMWRRIGIIAFVTFGLALWLYAFVTEPSLRKNWWWTFFVGPLVADLAFELLKRIWGAPPVPSVPGRLSLPPLAKAR